MIGERLTSLRKERKWTQEDIATKVNMPRSTYSNYENGKREPDFETTRMFAELFGVSIDYLLGRTNDKHAKIEFEQKTKPNINEIVLREIVDRYNLDLSIPGNKEKLEKIIQIVAEDFEKKSQ